jgi:hypothetical protein
VERKAKEIAARAHARKDTSAEKLQQQQAEKQLKGEAKVRKLFAPKPRGSKKA